MNKIEYGVHDPLGSFVHFVAPRCARAWHVICFDVFKSLTIVPPSRSVALRSGKAGCRRESFPPESSAALIHPFRLSGEVGGEGAGLVCYISYGHVFVRGCAVSLF